MKKKVLGFALSVISLSAIGLSAGVQGVDAANKTTNGEVTYTEGQLELNDSELPDNLKFGSHEIQFDDNKTYYATDSGLDNENSTAADLTTGTVSVTDNRIASTIGWRVNVQQVAQFTSGSNVLDSATLSTYRDSNNLPSGVSGVTDFSGDQLSLVPGDTLVVLSAATNDTGSKGTTELDLTHFTLDVPASTAKEATTYTSQLNWTVSNTPGLGI